MENNLGYDDYLRLKKADCMVLTQTARSWSGLD